MEELQEQARFVTSGDDVTINLIPAFSAYLLGVAGKVYSTVVWMRRISFYM